VHICYTSNGQITSKGRYRRDFYQKVCLKYLNRDFEAKKWIWFFILMFRGDKKWSVNFKSISHVLFTYGGKRFVFALKCWVIWRRSASLPALPDEVNTPEYCSLRSDQYFRCTQFCPSCTHRLHYALCANLIPALPEATRDNIIWTEIHYN